MNSVGFPKSTGRYSGLNDGWLGLQIRTGHEPGQLIVKTAPLKLNGREFARLPKSVNLSKALELRLLSVVAAVLPKSHLPWEARDSSRRRHVVQVKIESQNRPYPPPWSPCSRRPLPMVLAFVAVLPKQSPQHLEQQLFVGKRHCHRLNFRNALVNCLLQDRRGLRCERSLRLLTVQVP